VHYDHHALAFTPDGARIFDGNDGGVWSTRELLGTWPAILWTSHNETLGITEFYPGISIDPTNPQIGYGGTQDNGSLRYTGALVWTLLGTGDGGPTAVDFNNPAVFYFMINGALHRSDTGPVFFIRNIGGSGITSPLVMDPTDSHRLYSAGNAVWVSNDRGVTWQPISPRLVPRGFLYSMAIAPSDPNILYVGHIGPQAVQATHNALVGGIATWMNLTTPDLPDNRPVTAIAVDPQTASTVYLAFGWFVLKPDTKGQVFKTTTGGAQWTDVGGNLPNTQVHALVIDPDLSGTLYIGTDQGAFFTTNDGKTWNRLGRGLPRLPVVDIKLHRPTRTLRAATYGRGMWDLTLP